MEWRSFLPWSSLFQSACAFCQAKLPWSLILLCLFTQVSNNQSVFPCSWIPFQLVWWAFRVPKALTKTHTCFSLKPLPPAGSLHPCHLPGSSAVQKESTCNAGDTAGTMGSIPGLGRSPGGGHGHPLQYSCLENPMNKGAWWATVHRITESWTRLKQLSTHSRTRS